MARDTVDGHDVFAVRSSIHSAVRRAREHSQPTLIEAKTYRYRGHSMADPGKYRTKDDVEAWKARDPILVLGEKLDALGMSESRKNIDERIEEEIKDAVNFAEESPFPSEDSAFDYVYAE